MESSNIPPLREQNMTFYTKEETARMLKEYIEQEAKREQDKPLINLSLRDRVLKAVFGGRRPFC